METAALKTSPARWYDRQAFARVNLAQFSGRFVAAYRRLDPQAITGFEGTGTLRRRLRRHPGHQHLLRPLSEHRRRPRPLRRLRASSIRSNWMGYSKTADALSDAAWRMIMKGVDSVWYWMWDGVGNWRGYLSPDARFLAGHRRVDRGDAARAPGAGRPAAAIQDDP